MLALIGSDGKRAYVRRAIATEASYVLRDLLDAYDFIVPDHSQSNEEDNPIGMGKNEDSRDFRTKGSSSLYACDESNVNAAYANSSVSHMSGEYGNSAAAKGRHHRKIDEVAKPFPLHSGDQMDYLFGAHNSSYPKLSSVHENNLQKSQFCADMIFLTETQTVSVSQCGPETPLTMSTSALSPQGALDVIEVPFPYFTGDILKQVCAHMTAHYQLIPTIGGEYYAVQLVQYREIPRPMVLPLSEYLDPVDQDFIKDWDEPTTVKMVKAATLLNYEVLLQLASAKLASYLCYKNVDGIRNLLQAESDFTPNEEAEIRKELMETDVLS